MMPTDAEVEEAAKAIWNDHNPHRPWECLSGKVSDAWAIYKYDARTALEAAERIRAKDPMQQPFNVRDGETLAEAWTRNVAECRP